MAVHMPLVTAQVTLADSASAASRLQGRHFEGVLEATLDNKRQYSQQHGYAFIDASSLLDGGCRTAWACAAAQAAGCWRRQQPPASEAR
jgi:hypothetical protein